MTHDAGEGPGGAGCAVVRSAENGDGGDAESGGNMHGAGIVGQKDVTGRSHGYELRQRGFAGIVVRRDTSGDYSGAHLLADWTLGGGAEYSHWKTGKARHLNGGVGEAIRIPSLCSAESSSGADSYRGATEHTEAIGPRFLDTEEADGLIFRRQSVEDTGAAEKFKVVEPFMLGNISLLGNRDRTGQQEGAPVSRVPDALGNSRSKGNGGRFKGILEQDGGVETARPQGTGEGELIGEVPAGKWHYVIGKAFMGVKVENPGTGQYGDMGIGVARANGAEGWQAHHGIAHPVGGADKDLHRDSRGRRRLAPGSIVAAVAEPG